MKETGTEIPQARPNEFRQDDNPLEACAAPKKSAMSKSMHDGVEIWCDCCSCEAEPYWVEAMRKEGDSEIDGE